MARACCDKSVLQSPAACRPMIFVNTGCLKKAVHDCVASAASLSSLHFLGCGLHTQYAVELTTYFSRIALYLGKHVVPRSTNDLIGAVQPHIVEDQIKPGDGMVSGLMTIIRETQQGLCNTGGAKRLSGGMKREHFTSTVLCARTWAAVCLITLSTSKCKPEFMEK
eukprot:1161204-Pelagomonas_calceolata.AAC.2